MAKWESLKRKEYLMKKYDEFMGKYGKFYDDDLKSLFDREFIDSIGERLVPSEFTQLYDKFGAIKDSDNIYLSHLSKLKSAFNLECNILEVGGGYCPTFAAKIASEQIKLGCGKITVYDPNIIVGSIDKYKNMTLCKNEFTGNTDISKYDLVIGLMPCISTKNIIEALSKTPKDFYIAFCGCDHFAYEYGFYQYGFFRPSYNDDIRALEQIVKENNLGELEIDYLDDKYEIEYPIAYTKKIK